MVAQDTMTTETVPRLYKEARPGADFQNSLNLLQRFKAMHPNIPTKSGLMCVLRKNQNSVEEVYWVGAAREKPVLLDVREPWEFEICHIDGALTMPTY